MRPSLPGSGKFGTPCRRTHRANLSEVALTCCCSVWLGGRPPFGSKCPQALCADWNRDVLTPSCRTLFFGGLPLLSGSGYLGTPLERMQREKTSHPLVCADTTAGPGEEL